ncbi:MAG: MFS transporter [Eubacteriaceae bacterium]|nr:MFS transporter [Eubacteriaceae bacterium]
MKFVFIAIAVFFTQMIMSFEASAVYTMAPFLADSFGIDSSRIILVNIGFASAGLTAPIFGFLSEKYGKKKFMILGLMAYLLGETITGMSQSSTGFIAGRTIIGLGFYSLSGLLLAYLSEFVEYEDRGKAFSIVRIATALGVMFSPMASAYMITNYSLQSYYMGIAALTGATLILALFLPKGSHDKGISISMGTMGVILKKKHTKTFLFINFTMSMITVLYFGYLSIHLKETFMMDQLSIGRLLTFSAFGTLAGVISAGYLSDRVGKLKMTAVYFIILIFSMFMVSVSTADRLIYFTLLFTLGFDGTWTIVQTISSEIVPEDRSLFMSLVFLMVSVAMVVFYLVSPLIYRLGKFYLNIGFCLVFLVLSFGLFVKFAVKNKEYD